jgi:hypothetical protein
MKHGPERGVNFKQAIVKEVGGSVGDGGDVFETGLDEANLLFGNQVESPEVE